MSDSIKITAGGFPSDYQPLPVEVLKDISERYDRDIVVVLSWSKSNRLLNSSSYGREAAQKDQAGAIAGLCTQALGYADGSEVKVYADFRDATEAAQSRERAETAERQLFAAERFINLLWANMPVETIVRLAEENQDFRAAAAAYVGRPDLAAKPQASPVPADLPKV